MSAGAVSLNNWGNCSRLSALDVAHLCLETGDPQAWEEFVRRFQSLIIGAVVGTARRWGANSVEWLDDLVQDAYLKLCSDRRRLLSRFQAASPDAIYGYLRVVTSNVVHDHFKAQHRTKRGGGKATLSLAGTEVASDDPAATMERRILLQEVDRALDQSSERDRTIFWLYYQQGWTAQAIAAHSAVCLTRKGVESAILRLTRHVRNRLLERHALQ